MNLSESYQQDGLKSEIKQKPNNENETLHGRIQTHVQSGLLSPRFEENIANTRIHETKKNSKLIKEEYRYEIIQSPEIKDETNTVKNMNVMIKLTRGLI